VKHGTDTVRPSVSIVAGFSEKPDGTLPGIRLVNNGVGPAFVTSITVGHGSRRELITSREAWQRLLGGVPEGVFAHWFEFPEPIAAGASADLIICGGGAPDPATRQFTKQLLRGLSVEVEYESVYGERFHQETKCDN